MRHRRIADAPPLVLAVALAAIPMLAGRAQAAVITFDTAPFSVFSSPVTENGFTYSTLSGSLAVNSYGHPQQDMEGNQLQQGGVLDIVAVSGGAADFTYSGLDYAAFRASGTGSQTLTVTGLLDGAVVGIDT
jgi:hypothetical protein